MKKILSSKSNIFTLILNGKIEHLLSPWNIEVNLNEETITISKRNLYYIGKDTDTIAFKFIRKININEHLFGSDIWIKAIGGSVSARYLPKKDMINIRRLLIDYNQTKTNHIIFS
jgi:hypothetical protein